MTTERYVVRWSPFPGGWHHIRGTQRRSVVLRRLGHISPYTVREEASNQVLFLVFIPLGPSVEPSHASNCLHDHMKASLLSRSALLLFKNFSIWRRVLELPVSQDAVALSILTRFGSGRLSATVVAPGNVHRSMPLSLLFKRPTSLMTLTFGFDFTPSDSFAGPLQNPALSDELNSAVDSAVSCPGRAPSSSTKNAHKRALDLKEDSGHLQPTLPSFSFYTIAPSPAHHMSKPPVFADLVQPSPTSACPDENEEEAEDAPPSLEHPPSISLGSVPFPQWRTSLLHRAHSAGRGDIGKAMEWRMRNGETPEEPFYMHQISRVSKRGRNTRRRSQQLQIVRQLTSTDVYDSDVSGDGLPSGGEEGYVDEESDEGSHDGMGGGGVARVATEEKVWLRQREEMRRLAMETRHAELSDAAGAIAEVTLSRVGTGVDDRSRRAACGDEFGWGESAFASVSAAAAVSSHHPSYANATPSSPPEAFGIDDGAPSGTKNQIMPLAPPDRASVKKRRKGSRGGFRYAQRSLLDSALDFVDGRQRRRFYRVGLLAFDTFRHKLSRYQTEITSLVKKKAAYKLEGHGDLYVVACVADEVLDDYRHRRISAGELYAQVKLKLGHTKKLSRRRAEYRYCDVGQTHVWLYTFHVKCRYLAERLIHLTLLQYGATRVQNVGPPGAISTLETQLAESEALVRHLRLKLAYREAGFKSSNPTTASLSPSPATITLTSNSNPLPDGATASLYIMRASLRAITTPPPFQVEDSESTLEQKFQLRYKVGEAEDIETKPWLGKSSSASLVKAAVTFKADILKQESPPIYMERNPSNDAHTSRAAPRTSRRTNHWQRRLSPLSPLLTSAFDFPPDTLMSSLIDLYFTQINIYIPLLHRPTFEKYPASASSYQTVHHRNDAFAATLLLVCAIASRYSDDPDIVAEGMGCGWRWFNQTIEIPSSIGNHLFTQTTLYELQYFPIINPSPARRDVPRRLLRIPNLLDARRLRFSSRSGKTSAFTDEQFLKNLRPSKASYTSGHFGSWHAFFFVTGISTSYNEKIYLDGQMSCSLGRACGTDYFECVPTIYFDPPISSDSHNPSLDIGPPLEVDDEFWEDRIHPFEQPHGVPSTVTFFNSLLQLNHILSVGLTILYPAPKTRHHSSLDNWLDRVPEHLRWEPTRENQLFFDQSVALHAAYYYVQMLIHRPFIPMLRKSASTALPSLAICTNAARSCANIVDIQRQRNETFPAIINLGVVFTSAIILLLNVWSMRRTGESQDITPELKYVQKCMHLVKLCEERWQLAGLLWDILAELMSVGHLQPPTQTNWGSSWPSMLTENTDTMNMDPAQATQDLETMLKMVDTLWANAPVGLDADVWGTYLNSLRKTPQESGEFMGTPEY
ncbi:hypothetical protein R3P38DRAFT_3219034 [Favolaschia claudopus]|uniref:Xylanolytic transcriptional activator regulatory domain-containing protein n=1 Tax=Favolaschia claudopus TaxID=2862362 RepID=A0AAW0A1Y3_9AGAR